jgi:hypothetical protein
MKIFYITLSRDDRRSLEVGTYYKCHCHYGIIVIEDIGRAAPSTPRITLATFGNGELELVWGSYEVNYLDTSRTLIRTKSYEIYLYVSIGLADTMHVAVQRPVDLVHSSGFKP